MSMWDGEDRRKSMTCKGKSIEGEQREKKGREEKKGLVGR